jgi:hypothetical protein
MYVVFIHSLEGLNTEKANEKEKRAIQKMGGACIYKCVNI